MVEQILPDDHKILADRLKHEAEASRPAFSETLHARIVQTLEQASQQHETQPPPPPARSWWREPWLLTVAAAVCLVITSLAAWRLAVWSGPRPDPIGGAAVVPSTPDDSVPALDALVEMPDGTARRVGTYVDLELRDRRWAYLDHDARLAAELLMDQLPLDLLASNDEP